MRILVSTTPGRGHVYPMVPLARALLAQGDEVLWLTGAESCAALEHEGFRTVAVGMGERDGIAEVNRRFPEIAALPPAERPVVMFSKLFGAVRAPAALPGVVTAVQDWAPDLVICDASEFAGHIAAASKGVPSLTHAFGSLIPEARVASAGAEVAPLWETHALEPRPYGGSYEHLYLDIYPSSLQPQERGHIPASQLLRPGMFAAAGEEALPDGLVGAPLVYVTFGTLFSNDEVLSLVVRALRALPIRVLVTVGPNGDPAALGAQPENVHVATYIPQDQVLPLCSAVVSHAGSGTFLAALATGLPQLCLPQAADQFLNAAACARSGTGIALQPGEVTEEGVAAAVQSLLAEDSYRLAAERIRAEIAAMPEPGQVAAMLHAAFG
jgi:UDP:flavonoid glycosyltransferase YjiC (YdhE family)